MSADLVPAENLAQIEALDPAQREIHVTRMLSEARQWLAHAVESTEPQSISEFKAVMATVAEATKQMNLSKEIQLDAAEMVRRSERGLGQAIRKGQKEGSVFAPGRNPYAGNQHESGEVVQSKSSTPSGRPVTDFATQSELTNSSGGIYDLTDGVPDEQFDAAIEEAKAEKNLSRANVVRKIKGVSTIPRGKDRASTDARWAQVEELARTGRTSDQIAASLKMHRETVRTGCKERGIELSGDAVFRGTVRRNLDVNKVVTEIVLGLEASRTTLARLTQEHYDDLDPEQIEWWSSSLKKSVEALNTLRKELNHHARV